MPDRYFRTVLVVEVLGNEPYTGGLGDLSYATGDGPYCGTVLAESSCEVDQPAVEALLALQGSAPDFLTTPAGA